LLWAKVNLLQLTPGAGAMYCGGCLRDNALVAALRKLGHQVLMVPLYLPLTLDEEDQSTGTPLFFGGISVYLEQKSPLFRGAPGWLHDLFASRRLLQWAAGKAAKTRAADLGELTLSMLRGEAGNQARELEALIAWLKTQPKPDVLCLSNALLIGMVRRLKAELRVPVACALQGEDAFLDALPEDQRAACWRTLAERAAEVDLFIAPSRYFGDLMRERLGLPADRVRVVHNGINLDGYAVEGQQDAPFSTLDPRPLPPSGGPEQRVSGSPSPPLEERVGERRPFNILNGAVSGDIPTGCRTNLPAVPAENDDLLSLPLSSKGGEGNAAAVSEHRDARKEQPHPSPPVLGFFARMCREKGLDTLVEAYIVLRQRGRVGNLKLRVGGSCGPADGAFVDSLRERLQASGLLGDVEFHPNLDRASKLEFLRSLSVFSVPALYGEAFGLYVIEALAAGVPVVQPRTAAFPELIEATGGGVLCAAGDARALAEAVEELLLDPARARALGEAGRHAVTERFSAEAIAQAMVQAYGEMVGRGR
jgi:glycosyltransferase involved in cell wall biosynthesis